jgi:nicotinamide-nucleotide amidase
MKIEIIIVGDEIIEGFTQDTNSQYLASILYKVGLRPLRITKVGDDEEEIATLLKEALKRSDIIIVTGGLGPTPDDRTREASAKALGLPLVKNEAYLERIKGIFEKFKIPFTEAEERFALLPEGAEILPNPIGLCGFKLIYQNQNLFFLPGVPQEVKAIVEISLLPFLQEKSQLRFFTETIRCFGLTEGQAQKLLQDIKDELPVEIAYLPHPPELQLRIKVKEEQREKGEEILRKAINLIRERLGEAFIGLGNETLEEVVGIKLRQNGFTLATAESCTGGLIAHRITQIPGSSEYFLGGIVCYSNESKIRDLGIPVEVIERYGPVSFECAQLMAEKVKERFKSTFGLATTGIAGPGGGTAENPVGTVYIGLAGPEGTRVKRYQFWGNREQVKLMASEVALDRLRRWLISSNAQ